MKTRAAYRHFLAMPTRWMDNDVYGHVNERLSLQAEPGSLQAE